MSVPEQPPEPPQLPVAWVKWVRAVFREKAAAHAALNVATGIIYAAGGVATTPALALMQQVMPMRVWGLLWLAAGALQTAAVIRDWLAGGQIAASRTYTAGHTLGAVIWMTFTLFSVLTLPITTAAAGSVLVAYVAAGHLTALRVRRTEARQQRRRGTDEGK